MLLNINCSLPAYCFLMKFKSAVECNLLMSRSCYIVSDLTVDQLISLRKSQLLYRLSDEVNNVHQLVACFIYFVRWKFLRHNVCFFSLLRTFSRSVAENWLRKMLLLHWLLSNLGKKLCMFSNICPGRTLLMFYCYRAYYQFSTNSIVSNGRVFC